MAWGIVSKHRAWYNLLAPDRYALTLAANEAQHQIDQQDVGLLTAIEDFEGREFLEYLEPEDFRRQAGVSPLGWVTQQTQNWATLAYFTDVGQKDGKTYIRVHGVPQSDLTCYVRYTELGGPDNIGKMSPAQMKAVVHCTMSLLAKPAKVDDQKWFAVTYKEDQLFQAALDYCGRIDRQVHIFNRQPRISKQLLTDMESEFPV